MKYVIEKDGLVGTIKDSRTGFKSSVFKLHVLYMDGTVDIHNIEDEKHIKKEMLQQMVDFIEEKEVIQKGIDHINFKLAEKEVPFLC